MPPSAAASRAAARMALRREAFYNLMGPPIDHGAFLVPERALQP
jgi:hypothetical protein